MKRGKTKLFIIVTVLLLSMTIGFAIVSTNLNITGDILVKSQTWEIYFSNVRLAENSIEAESLNIDQNIPTQVNYTVNLNYGEKFEFLVDANNKGTLTALIGTISNDLLEYSDNITYNITYLNGSDVAIDQPLYKDNLETYKVSISYTGTDAGTLNITSSFIINYVYGKIELATASYSLVGRVYDQDKNLLTGGQVVIDDIVYQIDSNGSYLINNLTSGEHIIEIKDQNGNLIQSDTFTIQSGSENSIVDNVVTSLSYLGMNANILLTEESVMLTFEPVVNYKCKRATVLHTETCSQNFDEYYCSGVGKKNTIITYGNLGTAGTLTSGDAFDCDVDGTGYNHRFYYVSDLYNTTDKEFDNDYAVLIYYNNTTKGIADNTSAGTIGYDSSYENWHGPVTAIVNLPTTTQWSNVSLSNSLRAITTQTGTNATDGGTLPTSFSYVGYAARFLTVQEVNSACGITVGSQTPDELKNCEYLMENTRYSNNSLGTAGYWLENPRAIGSLNVWSVHSGSRYVDDYYVNNTTTNGVRPAIEVLKTDIEI